MVLLWTGNPTRKDEQKTDAAYSLVPLYYKADALITNMYCHVCNLDHAYRYVRSLIETISSYQTFRASKRAIGSDRRTIWTPLAFTSSS